MIHIVIAGPRGNMGKEAVKMVMGEETFTLTAVVDRKHDGARLKDVAPDLDADVPVYTNMEECFQKEVCDVLIDLTSPETGKQHMVTAFNYNVRPVVGTTGFTDEDIEELTKTASEKELGAIIAPNFAIGAILLMKFSKQAAKYMTDVEIIEQHHDKKLDAPSGTAIKTAQMIAEVREEKTQGHVDETETLQGARGADFEGMRIHSVRLPGRVAHQEVLFGGQGQTLTLRHDSLDRTSFMPGVKLAVDEVMHLKTLVYGLDQLID
ncbi:4-hydroxy-tetrahydrodipicolinate reductase [Paenalkalicoccus suaedae]|uniref:4-hydroxy-tetrahydrodipicolinate reductase n=1 Tax=Paenalkalicoccus suaedae TaxID=2592382 RepID=A0A859FFX9_9BACI|nr:4-hydroxy-tetrahydrodipicolinate reductase [Paenalkalicoccus suaedae]QKS71115.1 4-hydroxy-tetrahydrodipicolinate reductase [Paenalkalicoccus suaedae]